MSSSFLTLLPFTLLFFSFYDPITARTHGCMWTHARYAHICSISMIFGYFLCLFRTETRDKTLVTIGLDIFMYWIIVCQTGL